MNHQLRRLAATMSLAGLFTLLVPAVAAQAVSKDCYTGDAYAVGLTGLKLVAGAITVPDQKILEGGPQPVSPCDGGTMSASGLTAAVPPPTGGGTGDLADATIVTEQSAASGRTSTSTSNVTSATILPGRGTAGANVLSATVANASNSVNCGGSTANASSIATLTINGTAVTVPAGVNQSVTVPGPGGTTLATVIFNQQSYDATKNLASASAAVVSFPAAGTLAAVITGTVTISHAESDLTCADVTKSPNPSTANPGDNVTYTVTITNQSPSACTLNTVTDILPPADSEGGVPFTYVSGGPAGATLAQSTSGTHNVLTWTYSPVLPLAAGASTSFNFVAKVPSNEPKGTYTNTVNFSLGSCVASAAAAVSFSNVAGLAPVSVNAAAVLPAASAPGRPFPWLPALLIPLGLAVVALAWVSRRRSDTGA